MHDKPPSRLSSDILARRPIGVGLDDFGVRIGGGIVPAIRFHQPFYREPAFIRGSGGRRGISDRTAHSLWLLEESFLADAGPCHPGVDGGIRAPYRVRLR